MIDAERILHETYPDFKLGKDNKLVVKALKKLIHEDDFNDVIRKNQHLRGFAFLDKLLKYFNFSYQVGNDSYNNIPAEGRLIIVANHPIGTLDGLALVKLIRSVRPDVRIVANRVLSHMEPLQSIFLPVDVLSEKKKFKDVYKTMIDALEHEEAVIFFPAGEVSRITPKASATAPGKAASSNWRARRKRRCCQFISKPRIRPCFTAHRRFTNRWARCCWLRKCSTRKARKSNSWSARRCRIKRSPTVPKPTNN